MRRELAEARVTLDRNEQYFAALRARLTNEAAVEMQKHVRRKGGVRHYKMRNELAHARGDMVRPRRHVCPQLKQHHSEFLLT